MQTKTFVQRQQPYVERIQQPVHVSDEDMNAMVPAVGTGSVWLIAGAGRPIPLFARVRWCFIAGAPPISRNEMQ